MKSLKSLVLSVCFVSLVAPAATVENWYQVDELAPGLFKIKEDEHCSFFAIKSGDHAVLVDSGMGLSKKLGDALAKALGVKTFDVVVTHAHLDHVGLNFLAKRVGISKKEWEKFGRLNEKGQIAIYHRHFAKTLPWPPGTKQPKQEPWQPTDFLADGATFTSGDIKLEAIELPGHTEGSLGYFDRAHQWLFTGDLIYSSATWPHYLNFADSSFAAFTKSLEKVNALVAGSKPPLLLPAHGKIPLAPAYVAQANAGVTKIRKGQLAAIGPAPIPTEFQGTLTPESLMFEATEGATLFIKRRDLTP